MSFTIQCARLLPPSTSLQRGPPVCIIGGLNRQGVEQIGAQVVGMIDLYIQAAPKGLRLPMELDRQSCLPCCTISPRSAMWDGYEGSMVGWAAKWRRKPEKATRENESRCTFFWCLPLPITESFPSELCECGLILHHHSLISSLERIEAWPLLIILL